jgi:hypothetical protein
VNLIRRYVTTLDNKYWSLTPNISQIEDRPPSPDQDVILSASNSLQEHLGPSEEAEAEFAKELAKMVTDTSAESRKVDKKTALALWESAVLPPTVRKKRVDEKDDESEAQPVNGNGTMNFTVITKRGNKQQVSIFSLFFCSRLKFPSSDSTTCCSFGVCLGRSHSLCPDAG